MGSLWCPSASASAAMSMKMKMKMKMKIWSECYLKKEHDQVCVSVWMKKALVAAAGAALMITSSPAWAAAGVDSNYSVYYGTAASAANYGGYGGNSSKQASAEYVYDVPQGWKERLVSKVEKGTNGTDSEFYNPKKRTEKEYLTFLSGYRKLAPRDLILNNLALSDVDLQDQIAAADSVTSDERVVSDQAYYVYEIDSPSSHSLISVTCANNKLYAHFVKAPSSDWSRHKDILTHLHLSFHTLSSQ